jgi:hypothetical protein
MRIDFGGVGVVKPELAKRRKNDRKIFRWPRAEEVMSGFQNGGKTDTSSCIYGVDAT